MDEKIEKYIIEHTSKSDELLDRLYRETFLKAIHPEMISGPYLGKFLEIISLIKQPQNILEIGTFTGYSTICLAKGLRDGGKIYTIEINEELQEIFKNYFKEAKIENIVKPLIGDAKEIIKNLDVQFDIVFIDGSKREYPIYYELIFPKVKKGGLIIADNVLWYSNVVNEKVLDKDTEGIKKFNEIIKNDKRVENIILPIRDGIMMIFKL